MMRLRPLHLIDGYKVDHRSQYPKGTTKVYSNFTARYSRVPESAGITWFGLQYWLTAYLMELWDDEFFDLPINEVLKAYKRRINHYLGPDAITFDHIEALHKLGFLPLHIKGIDEGAVVPYGVPAMTITNTEPDFFWLTNMLETNLSNVLWQATTSASTAREYRAAFKRSGVPDAVAQFLGHDFSYRGLPGTEAAMLSGAAHLIHFAGTDTVPALDLIEDYYNFDVEKDGLLGVSVPATEHSVMSMGLKDGEQATFERLMKIYPSGFLSVVSDTWDLWTVIGKYLPALKDQIMARNGRLVIRPDSGDPVDILCGFDYPVEGGELVRKGVVECLWDIFGGTPEQHGRVLDSHIGVIYGDSITRDRQDEIARRLQRKGFSPANVVLGIGSYTYQMVTRDTHGIALKATYGEINGVGQAIFKKPATDDGSKNSAKGLLTVIRTDDGKLVLLEDQSWENEGKGELKTRFKDSTLFNLQTFKAVRAKAGAVFV